MELSVIIAVAVSASVLTHVVIHRIRVATRRSVNYDKCWAAVAQTPDGFRMALCLRPKYHRGQHAAALSDIMAAGYERAPF
jgi:hypothetical protein